MRDLIIAKTRMQMRDVFEVPCRGATFPIWPTRPANLALCPAATVTTFRGGYRLSQYSEVAITTFWVQRGVCGSIPASVQSKGKRGVALSSFGLPGLPLRGRPSGEPSSREGYQGSGRLRGGQGACWERRCRNDSNFVNREFVKDAVKANTEALLYAAVGFQMP